MDRLAERANKYYLESYDFNITDTPLNKLPAGGGALCESALLSIDLESSEDMLNKKNRAAYLKFSHIYLSLLNDIVSGLGSKNEWTGPMGDGIIAYFTDDGPSNNVWNALLSAIYAHTAVNEIIPGLSPFFKSLKLSVNCVIHYDTFPAARVGPWGKAGARPVGAPVHMLSLMQERTADNEILVSKDAIDRLDFAKLFGAALKWGNLKYNKILFSPVISLKTGKGKIQVCRFNKMNFEKLLNISATESP